MLVGPLILPGCGNASYEPRRMESDAELMAEDKLAFDQSPDVQLPELRKKLHAMGITDQEIREDIEENYVPIFVLTLPSEKFDKLDKVALAKLLHDSRYRFELKDREQVRIFAGYSVEEDRRRRKALSLRQLAAKGEMGKFPRYREGMPMLAYARDLEHYCGYQPGEALNVVDGRWLEYRNQMVDMAVKDQPKNKGGMASFKCIVRIVYATDLQSQFIGNRGRPGEIKV
jgi:hypothetical protein